MSGISFNVTLLFQFFQFVIGPLVIQVVREHGGHRCGQGRSSRHIHAGISGQLTYQRREFRNLGVLSCHMFTQRNDFLRQGRTGTGDARCAVQREADACVHHIFAVAYGTTQTEHNFFIRTVEQTQCCCVFTAVMPHAGRKGQLVIRIKIKGMQGC